MSAKSSVYANKRRSQAAQQNALGIWRGGSVNPVEFLNVIERCAPYSDAAPLGSTLASGTQSASVKSMLRVRDAYDCIKKGESPPQDCEHHDLLAHAIGVAMLRAIQIAGDDRFDNAMLPILDAATEGIRRLGERHHRVKVWGFDGQALGDVDHGLYVYEQIFKSSSPSQMAEAAGMRDKILQQQKGATN